MANEIIYICKSINNKNVREGELNILREYPEKLYFEFGESEMNIKKRYYNDLETMEIDYKAILAIKECEAKTDEKAEIASVPVDEFYKEETVSTGGEEKESTISFKPLKRNRRKIK